MVAEGQSQQLMVILWKWRRNLWDCNPAAGMLVWKMQLHWLPVKLRVQFKFGTMMHALYNKRSPSYLSDAVRTVAIATTLLVAVFNHLALRTMSCRVHFPSSVSGPSRMQDLPPGTAFQIKFVASLHLQPSEDIWKRFYSLKLLTLPRTFNIVMSAGHLCKWTQNRRW